LPLQFRETFNRLTIFQISGINYTDLNDKELSFNPLKPNQTQKWTVVVVIDITFSVGKEKELGRIGKGPPVPIT
jgi:hypothetical protein